MEKTDLLFRMMDDPGQYTDEDNIPMNNGGKSSPTVNVHRSMR